MANITITKASEAAELHLNNPITPRPAHAVREGVGLSREKRNRALKTPATHRYHATLATLALRHAPRHLRCANQMSRGVSAARSLARATRR